MIIDSIKILKSNRSSENIKDFCLVPELGLIYLGALGDPGGVAGVAIYT